MKYREEIVSIASQCIPIHVVLCIDITHTSDNERLYYTNDIIKSLMIYRIIYNIHMTLILYDNDMHEEDYLIVEDNFDIGYEITNSIFPERDYNFTYKNPHLNNIYRNDIDNTAEHHTKLLLAIYYAQYYHKHRYCTVDTRIPLYIFAVTHGFWSDFNRPTHREANMNELRILQKMMKTSDSYYDFRINDIITTADTFISIVCPYRSVNVTNQYKMYISERFAYNYRTNPARYLDVILNDLYSVFFHTSTPQEEMLRDMPSSDIPYHLNYEVMNTLNYKTTLTNLNRYDSPGPIRYNYSEILKRRASIHKTTLGALEEMGVRRRSTIKNQLKKHPLKSIAFDKRDVKCNLYVLCEYCIFDRLKEPKDDTLYIYNNTEYKCSGLYYSEPNNFSETKQPTINNRPGVTSTILGCISKAIQSLTITTTRPDKRRYLMYDAHTNPKDILRICDIVNHSNEVPHVYNEIVKLLMCIKTQGEYKYFRFEDVNFETIFVDENNQHSTYSNEDYIVDMNTRHFRSIVYDNGLVFMLEYKDQIPKVYYDILLNIDHMTNVMSRLDMYKYEKNYMYELTDMRTSICNRCNVVHPISFGAGKSKYPYIGPSMQFDYRFDQEISNTDPTLLDVTLLNENSKYCYPYSSSHYAIHCRSCGVLYYSTSFILGGQCLVCAYNKQNNLEMNLTHFVCDTHGAVLYGFDANSPAKCFICTSTIVYQVQDPGPYPNNQNGQLARYLANILAPGLNSIQIKNPGKELIGRICKYGDMRALFRTFGYIHIFLDWIRTGKSITLDIPALIDVDYNCCICMNNIALNFSPCPQCKLTICYKCLVTYTIVKAEQTRSLNYINCPYCRGAIRNIKDVILSVDGFENIKDEYRVALDRL